MHLELVEERGAGHTHGQQAASKLAEQRDGTEDEKAQDDGVDKQPLRGTVAAIVTSAIDVSASRAPVEMD